MRETKVKNVKRALAAAISIIPTAAILWIQIPTWAVIILLIILPILAAIKTTIFVISRRNNKEEGAKARAARYIWNQPIILAILLIPTLSILICTIHLIHMRNIGNQIASPGQSKPWQKELPAKIYWNGQPNPDMEQGLADTARLLGFRYEETSKPEEANIQVWPNSWMHQCKWLQIAAFVSLDRDPPMEGAQTANIYICRFTFPWEKKITGYSLMAHEGAHVFADIGHFGEGLMATGGGDGSTWFNEEETKELCRRINEFNDSVELPIQDLPKKNTNKCGTEQPQG